MAQTRWLHAGAAKVRVGVRDKHVVVELWIPEKVRNNLSWSVEQRRKKTKAQPREK
ncbi:MAG: hypothetical protein ACLPVW_09270 [Terriglobales bacterium]